MGQPTAHPVFARVYARLAPAMDRQGAGEHRLRLLAGLAGRVLELGAGDGANFALYPAEVTGLLAVEPEPYLRSRAMQRAERAAVPVEVVDGVADRLPAADGSVDAVVLSLVLCSIPDQQTALAEVFRVLRPGGDLRFYEHVAARPGTRLAGVQRFADATVWPRLLGGCHVGRDTRTAIERAGFAILDLERFAFPAGKPSPASPHILGRAVRPA